MSSSPFALIIPGQAVRTDLQQTSPTSFSGSVPVGGNHLVLFITAPLNLPMNMVAGIYLLASEAEGWKYLGWLSDTKPSAVFKTFLSGQPFQIGISIEPAKDPSMSLVVTTSNAAASSVPMQVLKNLYNYLTSFLGAVNDPNVAIPLRVFTEWHQGLLRKLTLDPQYLQKTAE